MSLGGIPIKDIPEGVLAEIEAGLGHFFVPILATQDHGPNPLTIVGSGTLVEIAGTHCILTAAHVLKAKPMQDASKIGLVLLPHESFFGIPREAIEVKELHDPQKEEWGPDLALLRIPPHFVSTRSAHKSFLNLPRQRRAFLNGKHPNANRTLALTGMVGEWSTVQADHEARMFGAMVQGRTFLTGMERMLERK